MNRKNLRLSCALTSAGAGLLGAHAMAATAVSITYDDLGASYQAMTATTGLFSARAVNQGALHSSGDVSRLLGPPGTATFLPGFVANPDVADFTLNIAVVHSGSSVMGMGSFMATDCDGDEITGSISGSWTLQNGFLAFAGVLSGVMLIDLGAADGTFNGSDGGAFGLNLGGPSMVYDGAIVHLTARAHDLFETNFTDAPMGVTAQITLVPLPQAAGAGAMGLLAMGLIRRRR